MRYCVLALLLCVLVRVGTAEVSQGSNESVALSDEELSRIEELIVNLIKLRDEVRPAVAYDDQELAPPEYENEWAVEIEGGVDEAIRIARANGYQCIGTIRGFEDTYIFKKENHRSKRAAEELTRTLRSDSHVLWAEQQRLHKRWKRDNVNAMFNDPMWPAQWQLHDSRDSAGTMRTDMNVIGAWKLGYTGKGVVVSILDDGIQHNHTDLFQNYDRAASYDLNDNDPDPMPTFDELNKHGTRCAGEVAMIANNSYCGVGVAYHVSIGGIRMLDGRITDRVEAEALSYNLNHIDIYSASWGPNDDGKTVEGPGRLAQAAILKGVRRGRQGRGAIYVWASGNGGSYDDNCDCDGYADSIYTFSVSSAAEDGSFPWYGETCASTLTTTYSTGNNRKRMIMTTDIRNKCTTEHSGTSASAPLAAGIIALALEANPSLTWRDVQHIAVWTAEPAPLLKENDGWEKNAFGLLVNTRFGFGLMNAYAYVNAAKSWVPVPDQHICTTIFPTFTKRSISDTNAAVVNFRTDGCEGQSNEVNFLEHLQLVLDIAYPIRGHLAIFLVSPSGTQTQLLTVRREDKSPAGFRHWPFMSVHTWGENPRGVWQLRVEDKSGFVNGRNGLINNLTLIVYGTKEMPAHYGQQRQYNMQYNDASDQRRSNNGRQRRWMDRARRLTNSSERREVTAERVDAVIRALDAMNQRQKWAYSSEPYSLHEFVSR